MLAKEIIDKIKNAEVEAENLQKLASEKARLIEEKAKAEAETVIASKIKEAKAKADLRVNFSKNEAKQILLNAEKEADREIKEIRNLAESKKKKAIEKIIEMICQT